MAKVIMFSRQFPAYHPKAGQPTYFVEKFCKSYLQLMESFPSSTMEFGWWNRIPDLLKEWDGLEPKHHTIRAGHRFKAGDYFSPRVWSGKPYRSKQIVIAPDIKVKKVWDFEISEGSYSIGTDKYVCNEMDESNERICRIAKNDGLELKDFLNWFQFPKPFDGQIICWSDKISY